MRQAGVWRQQSLNSHLTRRLQELEAELERRDSEVEGLRRDSHNSGLPPALDLPAAKAANSVRRTRRLRRRTGGRSAGNPAAAARRSCW
ncbi:MAG TPA: hypothetical protein VK422_05495 [Pyrinomonadaceae bacterium]|nr:hypothetical protein [Pyrinomonadaceae bacterium]